MIRLMPDTRWSDVIAGIALLWPFIGAVLTGAYLGARALLDRIRR